MSFAVTSAPGSIALALADMRLGVEQHRGGDDRRRLVDAELLQRRIRRGLHVALRVAAVIRRAAGGKLALAVPRLRQHREMAERVHLRALLAGIAARHLVGVEGVAGAGNADGRLGILAQRHRERRLRHGVGAQERQLVGLRLRDWRDRSRSASRWRGRACSPCRSRRPPARADGSAPAPGAHRPTTRRQSQGVEGRDP